MSRLNQAVVMLDFETTGMTPTEGARVTEVAALRIVGDEIVARYVSLMNTDSYVPPFITQLTGITNAMLAKAPRAEEVIPALLDFIGTDALAAHNASFDEKFLLAESLRLGQPARHSGLICSVKLARRVFPGHASYSLGNISSALGIRFRGTAHRAEADAEVAAHLLMRSAKQLGEQYGLASISPALLEKINRTPAAKVASLLQKASAAGLGC